MPVHIDKENSYIPSSVPNTAGKRTALGAKTFVAASSEKPVDPAAALAAPRTILGEKSTNVGLRRNPNKGPAFLSKNVNNSQLARKTASESVSRPSSAGGQPSLQSAGRASSSGSIRSSLYPRHSFPLNYANMEPDVYYPPPPAISEAMFDPVDYARLDYRTASPKLDLRIALKSLDEVSDFEVEFSDSSADSLLSF